jgi:hypothetical protein
MSCNGAVVFLVISREEINLSSKYTVHEYLTNSHIIQSNSNYVHKTINFQGGSAIYFERDGILFMAWAYLGADSNCGAKKDAVADSGILVFCAAVGEIAAFAAVDAVACLHLWKLRKGASEKKQKKIPNQLGLIQ